MSCVITALAVKLITLCRIGSFCVQTLNFSYSIVCITWSKKEGKREEREESVTGWSWNQIEIVLLIAQKSVFLIAQKSVFQRKGVVEKERYFIREANTLRRWQTSVSNTVSKLPIRGQEFSKESFIGIQLRLPRCNIALWWSSSDDQGYSGQPQLDWVKRPKNLKLQGGNIL